MKVILATGVADPAKTLPKALLPVPEGDILSLEARIHSITILPADGDSILVFAGPKTVDLLSLSSVAALLSSTTAPAGAYAGIEVKVSSARMILATSPGETQELVLADNGNYSLDFAFEIAEDSSGLLYIELGGLSVFQQEDNSYLLAPDLFAALRETLPDTRLEGTIASVDSATKSLELTAGGDSFTVDYDGAAIFLPSDYDTPSGTPASLVAGTRLAVTGTVGLADRIAPETIEVLDLPGTPDDEDGGMVTVCYFYGEDPVVAMTINVRRDRLPGLFAQGAIAGPCDGAEPFTLTYAAGPGGTLSGETTQSVVPGANGTAVTAVPNEGFAFVSWSDGSTLNPRTEVSVGADLSVTANFAELFTLTYNVGEGGTLVGEASQHVPLGGNGSPVTAVRNTGYVFKDWSDGRTDNPRSDLNVTADLSVTANFLKSVTLTYTAGAGGTLEGMAVQSMLSGEDGTPVTAVPGEGFVFVNWSDDRTDNPRSDLAVTEDITVTANFARQYTLTYTAGPNGSIEGAATQRVAGGSDGSAVTAVGDANFGFVSWSDGRTDNPRTDVDVDGDVSVTATFAQAVTLTYFAGPNGTLTGNTSQIVGVGGTGSPVTAVPEEGYGFDQWSDNRIANPRIDANVTTNISVTATFLETFTFEYIAGPNGTLTGATTQSVTPERSGTAVTAVPNTGFVFLRWSDGSTDNPRTDVHAIADISVIAQFAEMFTLNYVAGPNGTLTGNLTQSVREGSAGQPVTAVPGEGFGFAGWSDGRFDNPRFEAAVTADLSVTANFSASLSLIYTAGENGSISGVTSQQVPIGGDGSAVTAVPDDGYFFVEWSDGTSENPRIDENVQAGHGVTALFFRKPEMLSVPAGQFTMGRRDDGDDLEADNDNELPRHEVTLPAYEIGKYEVTNEEYALFLNYLGHPARGLLLRSDGRQWLGANETMYYDGGEAPLRRIFIYNYGEVMLGYNRSTRLIEPLIKENMHDGTLFSVFDHPVTESTWYGTAVYCNWLSERNGLEPVYDTITWEPDFSRNGYRMPTEAEWERAAAWDGEKHWIYGFQSDTLVGRDRANYYEGFTFIPPPDEENTLFVNPLGMIQDTQAAYTSPVGWFNGINISPNQNIQTQNSVSPVGAYDMSGNLFEWCHDWYSPTYYAESPAVDPLGPETGVKRVLRGGAWGRQVGALRNRTAYRWSFDPEDGDGIIGFRLVRSDSRLVQFNLNYTAGAHGTLEGAANQVVPAGEDGTPVTAIPDADYAFAGWSDGSIENPRTDTNVESNLTVTANFAMPITLTYAAGPNGHIEGELEQTFGIGGTGTPVLAVADEGYVFVRWSDDRTDNPRTDTEVLADTSVTAEFAQGFVVSYAAGLHGTISGEAIQDVVSGESTTPVTAVPDTGFEFVRWSDGSTENPRSDINVTADISVTAEFAELFTLSYSAGSNGSVSGELEQDVIAGGEGTPVTAIPESGFVFDHWSDERTDNPRTDVDVSADVTVVAVFVARAILTYSAAEGGTLLGEQVQELTPGEDGTAVTAVPDEGFIFLQWSDGSLDNPRVDLDVATSLTVEATFFAEVAMQSVPAGVFTMGRRDDGDDGAFGRSDELPRREVNLDAYEIGKYEITNTQFAAFLNFLHHPSRDQLRRTDNTPWAGHNEHIWYFDTEAPRIIFCYALSEDGLTYDSTTDSLVMKQLAGLPEGTDHDKGEHPVTEPTWYGAALFSNWLSERSGLEPVYNVDTWEADFTKNGYRLPTEAEWERAAAWDGTKHWIYAITSDTLAGRDRVNYHDGPYTSPPDYDNVYFVNPLGIVQNAKESYTSPVGWFDGVNVSPNGNVQTVDSHSPVGCYDMSGNVVEWCHDWYSATYYAEGINDNPTGPTTGVNKVARGGAWGRLVEEASQRTAVRFNFGPSFSDGMNGFRIAR